MADEAAFLSLTLAVEPFLHILHENILHAQNFPQFAFSVAMSDFWVFSLMEHIKHVMGRPTKIRSTRTIQSQVRLTLPSSHTVYLLAPRDYL